MSAALERGLFLASVVQQLVRLLDQYGEFSAVGRDGDSARTWHADALGCGAADRAGAASQKAAAATQVELPDRPNVRDLRIKPHRLEDYDDLGNDDEDDA